MAVATAPTSSGPRYHRPNLYPKQLAAIFDPARYGVIEASTKAGKTVGCLVWLFEHAARGLPGQEFWWTAPIYGQAEIAYRRLKSGLPPGLVEANETDLTLTLPQNGTLRFKSAEHPDGLFGEDVHAAVMDEATRCKEESWHALRSTLTATRGPVRIIGNVKGRKNWAYAMARKAESGAPDMSYHRLTAYDAVEAGVLSADEVEDAKRQLPENVFRELYLAEPSDDGGNPFGIASIRSCVAPLGQDVPVAWGWDLAKSSDWTVGIALSAGGEVVRFERWQGPWMETIERIHRLTGSVRALVDSTGVGDPILEALQKKPGTNYEGFKFSMPSKQQLMEGLAVAIQQKEITYPDGVIVLELESFEYVYSRAGVHYSAPAGSWDDCVCALALAAHLKGQRPAFVWGVAA